MKYFISIGLRPHGPLSLQQVKEEIKKAVVGPYDLVMKENESWVAASEMPEFPLEMFPAVRYFEEAADWIVLLKSQDKFQQEGPFSQADVLRLIREKVLDWETRAWRPGLDAWIKLSDRHEFRESFISLGL